MSARVAELGSTHDPKALVPGNPEAVRSEIAVCNRYSAGLIRAGEGLKTLDTGAWKGEAADSFHDAFDGKPVEWLKAGDALLAAADALTEYVEMLEWAQAQAAEAIALWDEAQAATQQAQAQHQGDVAREQQRVDTAPAGQPVQPNSISCVNPGAEKRAAATDMLHRARMQLIEAGDRTTTSVGHLRDEAPDQPGFWGQVGTGFSQFGQGLGDWVGDLGEIVANLGDVPANVTQAFADPVEFGKSVISWEQFRTNPMRASGHVLPDAALTLVGGAGAIKKGAGVAKGLRGSLQAAKGNRVLKRARHNGKNAAEHVANKGVDIGRKPDRNKKKPIRLVDDVGQLDQAWRDLSRGGQQVDLPNYRGQSVQMPDGSTISYREKPGKGPEGNTIDMTGPDGREVKIHIDPPKGN